MNQDRPLLHQAGMTVIELMVAILLAAILSAGLFYMTIGQTNTYKSQLKNLNTQQNVWAAMEYTQRFLREAGYGLGAGVAGCNNIQLPTGGQVTGMPALKIYNNCSLYKSTDGCATIDATGSGTGSDAHGVDSFEMTMSTADVEGGGGPALTINQVWNGNQTYTRVSCGGLEQAGQTPMLAVFYDPTNPTRPCMLATITNAQLHSGGPHGDCKISTTNGGDPWGINPPSGIPPPYFPPGSKIGILGKFSANSSFKFAIDVDHDPPRLMQWQVSCNNDGDCATNCPTCPPNGKCVNKRCTNDLQVVAVGIEDMQIAFGCDYGAYSSTTSGGTCDQTAWTGVGCKGAIQGDGSYYEAKSSDNPTYDEWAYNVPSDNPPPCYLDSPSACTPGPTGTCKKAPIGLVRISLVGRAPSPDPRKPQAGRPALEDRAAGPADSYDRTMLTSIVMTRNVK